MDGKHLMIRFTLVLCFIQIYFVAYDNIGIVYRIHQNTCDDSRDRFLYLMIVLFKNLRHCKKLFNIFQYLIVVSNVANFFARILRQSIKKINALQIIYANHHIYVIN